MLKKTKLTVLFFLCCFALTACMQPLKTANTPSLDMSPAPEYRFEIIRVQKRLNSGIAVFKVLKRAKHGLEGSHSWQIASDKKVELTHVGKNLIINADTFITDENGLFTFELQLKDPLVFFKWVKPESYPIAPPYNNSFKDVPITAPFNHHANWSGWDSAEINSDYFVKLKLEDVNYWLPVSYKDIRPALKEVSQQIFNDRITKLSLDLITNNEEKLKGVDIFLSGKSDPPIDILSEYITNEAALLYSAKVFPSYLQGKDGGYDQNVFFVLPGRYQLNIHQGPSTKKTPEIELDIKPTKQCLEIFNKYPCQLKVTIPIKEGVTKSGSLRRSGSTQNLMRSNIKPLLSFDYSEKQHKRRQTIKALEQDAQVNSMN